MTQSRISSLSNAIPSRSGISWRIFFTCWIVYGLHFATNTVREIYPALALGDHLSFDVSEYAGLHPDLFEIPGRGTFINNNPGASILAAIPYALCGPVIDRVVERVRQKRAESGASEPPEFGSPWPMAREFYKRSYERGLDVKFGLAAGVMQLLFMAPLSAFSAVVMFHILRNLAPSAKTAALLALLYAFATPVFFRTAQLNQNLLVSHCALFAFALLWRPADDPAAPKQPAYFLAGLLCGWSVVCDFSGLVVVLVMAGYGLVRRHSLPTAARSDGDVPRFIAGVMVAGAALAGYQWSCFGHPLYPAQHYMPPATFTHHGYVGMDWPKLDLLAETMVSPRFGLFVSSPILLLALYPPGWRRSARLLGGREVGCIAVFCVLFFLFCSANQYGRMQFNSGVRHIVPVTPFLFLPAAGVLWRMPTLAAVLVGIIATYGSWCLAMYRDVERGLGIPESIIHISLGGFRLPWLTTLERMGGQFPGVFTQGASAVPLLVLSGVVIWVIWRVGRPPTSDERS